jgi:hypothetical protein
VPAVDAITEAAERSREAVGAWLEAFQESPLAEIANQAVAAEQNIDALTAAMEALADEIRTMPSLPDFGGGGGGGGDGSVPGWPGIPGLPSIPPGGVFPEANRVAAVGGGGLVVNVTVQGTVVSERDLVEAVYTGLARKGLRDGGLSFSGSLA